MESQQNVQPVQSPTPSSFPKTSTGLEQNVAGLLCYIAGALSGLIFLLIEKDNKFVKFHAIQSIAISLMSIVVSVVFGFLSIIPFIGCITFVVSCIFPVLVIGLSIFLMIKAYNGEMYKLPVIGDYIEQNFLK